MTKLLKVIFLLFAFCIFGSSVYALSCSSTSKRPLRLSQDGISFAGTVIDIEKGIGNFEGNGAFAMGNPDTYIFAVDEVMKGKLDQRTIKLTEAIGLNQIPCADPVKGTKYIVNTSDGATMDFSYCSCSYAEIKDYSAREIRLLKSDILFDKGYDQSTLNGFVFWIAYLLIGLYIIFLLISGVVIGFKYMKQKGLALEEQTWRNTIVKLKKRSIWFCVFLSFLFLVYFVLNYL